MKENARKRVARCLAVALLFAAASVPTLAFESDVACANAVNGAKAGDGAVFAAHSAVQAAWPSVLPSSVQAASWHSEPTSSVVAARPSATPGAASTARPSASPNASQTARPDSPSSARPSPAPVSQTPSPWAAEDVAKARDYGLVPAGMYGGFASDITRAEFCSVAMALYRKIAPDEAVVAIDKSAAGATPFVDTSAPSIIAARELGIVKGVGGGYFSPDSNITRQEIAVMLHNTIKALGDATGKTILPSQAGGDVLAALSAFADDADVDVWAGEAVGALKSAEIMLGDEGNRFNPLDNTTKEMAFILVCRVYLIYAGQDAAMVFPPAFTGDISLRVKGRFAVPGGATLFGDVRERYKTLSLGEIDALVESRSFTHDGTDYIVNMTESLNESMYAIAAASSGVGAGGVESGGSQQGAEASGAEASGSQASGAQASGAQETGAQASGAGGSGAAAQGTTAQSGASSGGALSGGALSGVPAQGSDSGSSLQSGRYPVYVFVEARRGSDGSQDAGGIADDRLFSETGAMAAAVAESAGGSDGGAGSGALGLPSGASSEGLSVGGAAADIIDGDMPLSASELAARKKIYLVVGDGGDAYGFFEDSGRARPLYHTAFTGVSFDVSDGSPATVTRGAEAAIETTYRTVASDYAQEADRAETWTLSLRNGAVVAIGISV